MTDTPQAKNVRLIGKLDDIPGGGQIMVRGDYAYIGHMEPPHGTSIVDISDPKNPQVVATIPIDIPFSHSHKARVAGDLLITNVEQVKRHYLRLGEKLPELRVKLESELGHPPTDADLAAAVGANEEDIPMLDEARRTGYRDGGFRVFDIADPRHPKLVTHKRTHGFGVHRFDLDETSAYISTEVEGYIGNILVIYDLSDPKKLDEVGRWWLPGQHLAGGERPTWEGYGVRLHHAMRVGDKLWAACWNAGFRVLDARDVSALKTISECDYHPPARHPTHTILPVPFQIDGMDLAVVADEEHSHRTGQPHAGLWIFDVSDLTQPKPLAAFEVSERDVPHFRADTGQAPGTTLYRFGQHQFQEHIDDTLIFNAWFSGGLRIVDIADPRNPVAAGHYVPDPRPGTAAPQSNDVDTDGRGLIYLMDRIRGLDILEMEARG